MCPPGDRLLIRPRTLMTGSGATRRPHRSNTLFTIFALRPALAGRYSGQPQIPRKVRNVSGSVWMVRRKEPAICTRRQAVDRGAAESMPQVTYYRRGGFPDSDIISHQFPCRSHGLCIDTRPVAQRKHQAPRQKRLSAIRGFYAGNLHE